MRCGIYTEMQTPLDKPHAELTWEIMRQIEHADAVGFDTYSVIEHHFFQQFGISANPLAMFTAAAQRTRRIRFRILCHTLPLHNPLLLAGAIAEADILTNGRLECGIGRGHAWLYEPACVAMEESQSRFEEAIEILRRAWTQDRFSFDGTFYTVQEVEGFFHNYMAFNASAMDAVMSEEKKAAWRAKGFGFYASGVVEQFRTMTYEQILENGLAFVGTPAEVIEQIQAVDQQIGGLDEFVIMSNLGGMEHWRAIRTQELFATQVIPVLAPALS